MATNYKCHFCKVCNGKACISELPGMGGVRNNENFILNVSAWEKVRKENPEIINNFLKRPAGFRIPKILIAPMTGAVENIGFEDECDFYEQMMSASSNVGIGLCIGDGFPDEKIKFGIKSIEFLKGRPKIFPTEASVFIKPYSNKKIFERIEWSKGISNLFGVDIDSYNILTMRNLVNLEKKTAEQLCEIQSYVRKELKLPFAIKGIFTEEDIELVKEVKPDIAYISNHGGRVDTRKGSTAEFLLKNARVLKEFCGEVWVDGGIRTPLDIATAHAIGADRVLIGRPFVTALCKGGEKALCQKVLDLSLIAYAAS